MKKGIPLLIIGVLLISGLGAIASPTDDHEYRTVTFNHLTVSDHETHLTLELTGANNQLVRPNQYTVPTYTETFTFPFGTTIQGITVDTENLETITLTKPLEVVPNPVIIGTTPQATTTTAPQTTTTWYEYDVGTGIVDNERQVIVKIQAFPVQYNPKTNQITTAENLAITIHHTPPAQTTPLRDDYNLIILCADDYADELAPLATHKQARGITTKIVTLSEIYGSTYFTVQGRDNQEKIKYFIKDAIEQWGSLNVLLVGGSVKFPTRQTHIHVDANPPDNEIFVSDLYYADIYDDTRGFSSWDTNANDVFGEYDWNGNTDDVDLYPDIYLGRLAAVSATEVTTAVNKIKTYETNEAYTQPWFGDIVLMGGDSFPEDEDDVLEGEVVNNEVVSIMSGFIPNKIQASNGKLSGVLPTGVQNINNAINSGAGWVDFSGHGNTAVWATHPYDNEHTWLPTPTGNYQNSHVKSLSNGNELPIVITGACSVAKYNIDTDCFSWSFILNSGGGGIGSFGATGLGWAYTGNYVTEGLIEGMCINMFEAYADEGATSLGEMWAKAVESYIGPGMQGTDYKTVEEWQSFCDPSTAIGAESNPPVTPTDLDGPTNPNYQQTHSYSASSTDPDGDKVYYLFDWGDDTFSGWIGPYNSGTTGYADHQWTEQGNFEIRVRAKDDHGTQSEWSDPLPITLPKAHTSNTWFQYLFNQFLENHPILWQILHQRPIIALLVGN